MCGGDLYPLDLIGNINLCLLATSIFPKVARMTVFKKYMHIGAGDSIVGKNLPFMQPTLV